MSGHPLLPQLKQRSKKEKKEEKEEHFLNEAEDDFIEDEVEENADNKSWCQCFNRCMRVCPCTTIAGLIAGTIIMGREIVHRVSSQWNGQQQRELLAEARLPLFVRMPDGKKLPVDVPYAATVADLCDAVPKEECRQSFRLSFGGKYLDDPEETLADAGVGAEATVCAENNPEVPIEEVEQEAEHWKKYWLSVLLDDGRDMSGIYKFFGKEQQPDGSFIHTFFRSDIKYQIVRIDHATHIGTDKQGNEIPVKIKIYPARK